MTEAERIDFLIRHLEGGNGAAFGKKIGANIPTVSKMRKGVVGYSRRINDIIAAYPSVSRRWLETGEGYPGDLSVDLVKSVYEEKINRCDRIIDQLSRRINELEERLKI